MNERMFRQAYETAREQNCKGGELINPFNKTVVGHDVCPAITTRPEGFKTAILLVEAQ